MHNFLDESKLQKLVPSIFATQGADTVSSKYSFIPTIAVVRALRQGGFLPVMAEQSSTRLEGRKNFVKHVMRFRHESTQGTQGLFPEIVLANSHDGTSSYQLRSGIYRLVCSNGLIVGNEIFSRKIRHQGDVIDKVVEAATDLIDITPRTVETALEWNKIKLNDDQKRVFAETASSLRWDEGEELVNPTALLAPRRMGDTQGDLWTTLNVIQENILRGGIRYRKQNGDRQRTRAVNSVNENVRLNTALWSLTEKMAQLVK